MSQDFEWQPTRWTRPMQMSVAAFFLLDALLSILITALFVNQPPMNNVAGISVWVAVIAFAAVQVMFALGSYLGWRRMFWAAFVLLAWIGVGGIITNIQALQHPSVFPLPAWNLAVREVLSLAAVGLLVWMWSGNSRYGPWATAKRRIKMPPI